MNATVVGLLVGVGAGVGLWLLIQAVRGVAVLPSMPRPTWWNRRTAAYAATGAAVALVVWWWTGWPVAAVAFGALAALLPRLLGGKQRREEYVERTDAVAAWTEMIRDTLAGAAGLEEALVQSSRVAPEAIRGELSSFVVRLDRSSLTDSLHLLAADLDNPQADFVIAALITAAQAERTAELGPLLGRLAAATREDIAMRLRVDVSRAQTRTSATLTLFIILATFVLVVAFARDLLGAYDTPMGQLWLAVVSVWMTVAGVALYRMAHIESPARFRLRQWERPRGDIR